MCVQSCALCLLLYSLQALWQDFEMLPQGVSYVDDLVFFTLYFVHRFDWPQCLALLSIVLIINNLTVCIISCRGRGYILLSEKNSQIYFYLTAHAMKNHKFLFLTQNHKFLQAYINTQSCTLGLVLTFFKSMTNRKKTARLMSLRSAGIYQHRSLE